MSIIPKKIEERSEARKAVETNVEIEEYQTRLELLYTVAQQVSTVSEVSELLEEILRVTQRIVHAEASSLLVINEEKGEFYLQAAGGEKSKVLKQVKLDLDTGVVGWVAQNNMPLVINDAYHDKRFNKNIDETTGFVTRSIMAAPVVRGQDVVGVLEIINKSDGTAFNERDLAVLKGFTSTEALVLLMSMAATAINNIKLCEAMQDEYKSTVATLVTAVDGKDPYARGHSRRVREYALMAAESLGFSAEQLQSVEFGAMLHDIGKIGISDSILLKAGPLTPGEWYIMRKHSLRGADIVRQISCLQKASEIVLYHHEHYDGTGYPAGLKGDEIPLGARLVAVADAFDTMTTDHSYRPALSLDDAIHELTKGTGTQFCPIAVEAFITGFQKQKGKTFLKEKVALEKTGVETEEKTKGEAAEKAGREAEEKVKKEDEEKTRREAEEQSWREVEEKVRRAAEEKAKREAEEKARREDEEKARREAEEKARREAEEKAKRAAEEKAKREVEEKARREAEEETAHDFAVELYEGEVQLVVDSPSGFEQVNEFRKCLKTVKNLKIVLYSWSEEEGYIVVVSAQKPVALCGILAGMPVVERLTKTEGNIAVVLRPQPPAAA